MASQQNIFLAVCSWLVVISFYTEMHKEITTFFSLTMLRLTSHELR